MDIFNKEEVAAPTIEAAVAEAINPAAPKAEVKSAPAPVADAATDYWATAWANRGV